MKKNSDVAESVLPLFLRVRITQANPALRAVLSSIGPYYRVKRLVQLATLGLAVEEGRINFLEPGERGVTSVSALTASAATISKTVVSEKPSVVDVAEEKHYIIPEGAAAAMGSLFDSMS